MTRGAWLATTVLATVFLLASPAQAQFAPLTCNGRQAVLSHLAAKYKEAPVAIGVTTAGALVEVLASENGETWTIIVTTPGGMSCFLAVGEGWRQIKPKPAGPQT